MIQYDRHIFDKIDNPDKAYWLGFIIADGYINENKHMVRIKLGNEDGEKQLLKYINFLQGNEDMLKTERHNTTNNLLWYVTTYSKEITNALINLGVRQAKSCKETIPDIPKHLYKDLIRGLWDGDGFIRKEEIGIGLVGSYEVLSFVQKFFEEELNIKPKKICQHGKIFKIEYRAREEERKILELLYKDSNYYLDRKNDLYLSRL